MAIMAIRKKAISNPIERYRMVVLLDMSGSMSGDPVAMAHVLLKKLLACGFQITIVAFGSIVKVIDDYNGENLDLLGCTDLALGIDKLDQILEGILEKNDNINMIFITDGEANTYNPSNYKTKVPHNTKGAKKVTEALMSAVGTQWIERGWSQHFISTVLNVYGNGAIAPYAWDALHESIQMRVLKYVDIESNNRSNTIDSIVEGVVARSKMEQVELPAFVQVISFPALYNKQKLHQSRRLFLKSGEIVFIQVDESKYANLNNDSDIEILRLEEIFADKRLLDSALGSLLDIANKIKQYRAIKGDMQNLETISKTLKNICAEIQQQAISFAFIHDQKVRYRLESRELAFCQGKWRPSEILLQKLKDEGCHYDRANGVWSSPPFSLALLSCHLLNELAKNKIGYQMENILGLTAAKEGAKAETFLGGLYITTEAILNELTASTEHLSLNSASDLEKLIQEVNLDQAITNSSSKLNERNMVFLDRIKNFLEPEGFLRLCDELTKAYESLSYELMEHLESISVLDRNFLSGLAALTTRYKEALSRNDLNNAEKINHCLGFPTDFTHPDCAFEEKLRILVLVLGYSGRLASIKNIGVVRMGAGEVSGRHLTITKDWAGFSISEKGAFVLVDQQQKQCAGVCVVDMPYRLRGGLLTDLDRLYSGLLYSMQDLTQMRPGYTLWKFTHVANSIVTSLQESLFSNSLDNKIDDLLFLTNCIAGMDVNNSEFKRLLEAMHLLEGNNSIACLLGDKPKESDNDINADVKISTASILTYVLTMVCKYPVQRSLLKKNDYALLNRIFWSLWLRTLEYSPELRNIRILKDGRGRKYSLMPNKITGKTRSYAPYLSGGDTALDPHSQFSHIAIVYLLARKVCENPFDVSGEWLTQDRSMSFAGYLRTLLGTFSKKLKALSEQPPEEALMHLAASYFGCSDISDFYLALEKASDFFEKNKSYPLKHKIDPEFLSEEVKQYKVSDKKEQARQLQRSMHLYNILAALLEIPLLFNAIKNSKDTRSFLKTMLAKYPQDLRNETRIELVDALPANPRVGVYYILHSDVSSRQEFIYYLKDGSTLTPLQLSDLNYRCDNIYSIALAYSLQPHIKESQEVETRILFRKTLPDETDKKIFGARKQQCCVILYRTKPAMVVSRKPPTIDELDVFFDKINREIKDKKINYAYVFIKGRKNKKAKTPSNKKYSSLYLVSLLDKSVKKISIDGVKCYGLFNEMNYQGQTKELSSEEISRIEQKTKTQYHAAGVYYKKGYQSKFSPFADMVAKEVVEKMNVHAKRYEENPSGAEFYETIVNEIEPFFEQQKPFEMKQKKSSKSCEVKSSEVQKLLNELKDNPFSLVPISIEKKELLENTLNEELALIPSHVAVYFIIHQMDSDDYLLHYAMGTTGAEKRKTYELKRSSAQLRKHHDQLKPASRTRKTVIEQYRRGVPSYDVTNYCFYMDVIVHYIDEHLSVRRAFRDLMLDGYEANEQAIKDLLLSMLVTPKFSLLRPPVVKDLHAFFGGNRAMTSGDFITPTPRNYHPLSVEKKMQKWSDSIANAAAHVRKSKDLKCLMSWLDYCLRSCPEVPTDIGDWLKNAVLMICENTRQNISAPPLLFHFKFIEEFKESLACFSRGRFFLLDKKRQLALLDYFNIFQQYFKNNSDALTHYLCSLLDVPLESIQQRAVKSEGGDLLLLTKNGLDTAETVLNSPELEQCVLEKLATILSYLPEDMRQIFNDILMNKYFQYNQSTKGDVCNTEGQEKADESVKNNTKDSIGFVPESREKSPKNPGFMRFFRQMDNNNNHDHDEESLNNQNDNDSQERITNWLYYC